MEKYAWRAKIAEGKQNEYVKRHREIWPEMVQTLKEAGIVNYTIWRDGDDLFGYYECEKGIEYAIRVQNESEIVEKWNKYMSDILVWKNNKTQPRLTEVFRLE